MKKTIAFILLILTFVNLLSFWYFKLLQHQIKSEIKQSIVEGTYKDALTVIDAGNKSINWIEKGKEFQLDYRMYDVVRVEKKGSKTFLYCIDDTKEKQLIDNYTKTSRNSKSLRVIVKLISLQYIPVCYTLTADLISHKFKFAYTVSLYSSICNDLDTPPPQITL